MLYFQSRLNFNPCSPQGERRADHAADPFHLKFQSTLPAGGATFLRNIRPRHAVFQSTLPAGGATQMLLGPLPCLFISIHAPRRGSDLPHFKFVSTNGISIHAPRRGSDFVFRKSSSQKIISIHAPRRGSDLVRRLDLLYGKHFNPRSPQGERPGLFGYGCAGLLFQSTLPAGGATTKQKAGMLSSEDFNPRSPQGERLNPLQPFNADPDISIHAPRRGSDQAG